MLTFASGSSRVADIRGFAAIGRAIGVAAPELSPAAEAELVALTGRGIDVFVDSGAFSEVVFGPTGPQVVAPIDDAGWRRVLSLYRRLGSALGSRAHVVAPDRIGDQGHTLGLLGRWRAELVGVAATGARILVPMQKGALSQAEFHVQASAILGFDFTPAIPSKKNATTLQELEAFVAAVRPASLHLLGLGERNRHAAEALAAIEAHAPGCVVSLDANLIAASVGRSNGPAGGPRVLTRARDMARVLIEAGVTRCATAQELGIVLAFGEPTHLAAVLRR